MSGCSPPQPTRGLRERCEQPQRLRDGTRAENSFRAFLSVSLTQINNNNNKTICNAPSASSDPEARTTLRSVTVRVDR